MATDLGLDHSGGTAVAGLFGSNIVPGGNTTSTSFDLGAVSPQELGLEIKIVTDTDTPAGNQLWVVRAMWSHDNSDFTDQDLAPIIASGPIASNATDIVNISIPVEARYAEIDVENDQSSGPDITTSSTITRYDIYGDQA
jgi:hypothetical protein